MDLKLFSGSKNGLIRSYSAVKFFLEIIAE